VAATISGGPEYSYSFVLQMFLPVLERFGIVHEVANPSAEVDALHETHLSRGETSLFLSFAPPHRTTLGLRCPTIPVIAWEFPTIPNVVWEDEVRHDWRYVLRQTGRAITLSGFAAQAVKNAMGTDFPVVSIPAPVWDRQRAEDGGPRPHPGQIEIEIDGIVVDTRALALTVGMPIPLRPERDTGIATLRLDGVVFTSVLSPKDGRKNWSDILTAFAAAFRDTPDATLVFKMIGADPSYWWWEFHDTLSRLPAFACRVVAVSGYLDDSRYAALIDGSHWVVNASLAEGLCLPLLEFMSAGRPAIAPSHTAMADYIDSTNALPVASDEEFCGWPQDSRLQFTTTRHRIIWSALEAAYREGYRMVRSDPARYRALCEAAERSMRAFCGDDVIAAKLDSFLGLCSDSPPSAALSGLMVAEATA
jgi:glycosyltransferase involved in cell wall biosynthesis